MAENPGSTKQQLQEEVHKYFTGEEDAPYEMVYFKPYEPVTGGGEGAVRGDTEGGDEEIAGLLPGTDLRGFSGAKGRGVDARGDPNGDPPSGPSAAAGVSEQPENGARTEEGTGDCRQM